MVKSLSILQISLKIEVLKLIHCKMKNALIIGGSKGLGWACVEKLALEGFRVFVLHRDPRHEVDVLQEKVNALTSKGAQIYTYNKDALKKETQSFFMEELQFLLKDEKLNILVHSLAKGSLKSMTSENPLSSQDLSITIHAMGYNMYEWVSLLHQHQMFSTEASVVGFTSEGNAKVWDNYAAVSAAKATMESLMKSMAVSFAPFGIRTNLIQAGVCETDAFRQIPGHEQIALYAKDKNPFKRLTTPEDVANAVYLLSLDEAKWINGNILNVDGGESLR